MSHKKKMTKKNEVLRWKSKLNTTNLCIRAGRHDVRCCHASMFSPLCSFCLCIVQVTESESMSESYTFRVSHRHYVVIVLFILLFLFFLSSFSSSLTSLFYACVSLIQIYIIYIYICKMHFRLPSYACRRLFFFFLKNPERVKENSVMRNV
jgi:hypothetical protein